VGVSCRRNVLVMLLSVEILLNSANLAFVAFSRVHGNLTGQVFVFFAMAIAAAEVAVGLAIVVATYRLNRTADTDRLTHLRETDVGPVPPIVPEGPSTPAHGPGHGPEDGHGGSHAAGGRGPHDGGSHAEEPMHAGAR
jgi:NADH-quinone oxidoreductase subunit K